MVLSRAKYWMISMQNRSGLLVRADIFLVAKEDSFSKI